MRVDGDREGGCFWGGVCWEGVGCELDFGGFCFTTTNGLVGYLFWYIYILFDICGYFIMVMWLWGRERRLPMGYFELKVNFKR